MTDMNDTTYTDDDILFSSRLSLGELKELMADFGYEDVTVTKSMVADLVYQVEDMIQAAIEEWMHNLD